MGFYRAFKEGLFEDMLSFWPLQANMDGRERFLAAKRFGIYSGVLTALVTGSVTAAMYGLAIAIVSTIVWLVDCRLMRGRGPGKNPYNNYVPGVPPGSLPAQRACGGGGDRSGFQNVIEPWDLGDATRMTNMPHPDTLERRGY